MEDCPNGDNRADDEDGDDNNGDDLGADTDALAERAEGSVENQVLSYHKQFVPSCDQLSSSYLTKFPIGSQIRKRRRGNESRVVKW